MKDVAVGGRTVLFVTHNMGSALELCDRGLVISDGAISFDGDMDVAVREYLQAGQAETTQLNRTHFKGHLLDDIMITSITINGEVVGAQRLLEPDQEVEIEFEGYSKSEHTNLNLFSSIHSEGVRVMTVYDSEPGTALPCGLFRSRVSIPPKTLRPGSYTVSIGGEKPGGFHWFVGTNVGEFTIMERWSDDYLARSVGIVNLPQVGRRTTLQS